ncbi:PHP domain-containing protein [Polyangium jinanense]|uniref:PHP domain-containing protein n=1 Tax=Polyangium jinanense TaxID=2829994 RepID=UPI0023419698|nr:CehA/McbA family metallohydrolase [Polyangium jinanense]MDC3956817.1 PHP domain-containing protein [Polyangium jinanense]
MRSKTGKFRWIALGVGVVTIGVAAAVAFTRVPPEPTAIAAPLTLNIKIDPPKLSPPKFAETLDVTTFQRGNLHTHSQWSDGDRSPKDVYTWYRSHGYAFLALTDHDNRVSPETFAALERKGFVIIAGEEVTMWAEGKPVHINGLCTKKTIGGGRFNAKRDALLHGLNRVHEQGGVALVNHPNFDWALTLDDVRVTRGAELLEIWSGHPYVNTEGNAERPSHEAVWNTLLDEGWSIGGVAVDDAHHLGLTKPDVKPARPGKGWVQVFAEKPDRALICEGLAKGRLYSSSGVTLTRIRVTETKLSVWPKEEGAVVVFIGAGGKELAKVGRGPEGDATYELRGDETWVRARVALPDGKMAWTQAYRVVR